MISCGIESVRDDCMIEHLHMQFQMQNGYWQLAETTQLPPLRKLYKLRDWDTLKKKK